MEQKTNNLYIVIDEQYLAGPVKMEKPYDTAFGDKPYNEKDVDARIKWNEHLASLPRIARADNGKWKKGQELREGIDFMFTWRRDLSKTTFDTIAGPQHPFKQVAVTVEQWCGRSAIEQAQPKEEFYMPPDNGDICWQVGAETFTRKEVAHLLHTQRAMISNDLKAYCGNDLTKDMFDIINNPRKPEY